ncbi:rhomboid family intramembrane serine protease [Anaeromyxobacter dehalogenans]|uniref:Rhomboid-like protein n=1 Tax=Anaeromyxobacter dehalogenans (strain 2CP-C) TaxID=290397 RepID=Q2ILN8_ANADE|nr:rhomboid family intramembrane serine protease [Anaeromyxobacter dehalogenans]ABC82564.1 Rhomboid-like protein [Anaeromyxobacter dehalogenans 2CP-C]
MPPGAPRPRDGLAARLRAAPGTAALAALDLAVFGWVAAHGSTTDPALLARMGALDHARVWDGEPWRLLTAAFLHVGPVHLVWNLAFGVPLCALVERAIGTRRFLVVYLASALGGSAASMLAAMPMSAGASGALFGVAGAMLALYRRAVGSWRAFLSSRDIILNGIMLVAFALAGLFLPIDGWAHAGGLVTGAWLGWVASRPPPRRARAWLPPAAALGLAVALALRPDPRWAANRAELEALHAALRDGDRTRARAVLDAARARGNDAAGLPYYEGLLLAQEGDLEGALQRLRPLASASRGPARDEARKALAAVSKRLGVLLVLGEGRPADPERGRALLDEACGAGDADACRLAAEAAALHR